MREIEIDRERYLYIYMEVVQDLRILIFELYSERFDPAPPPSRENSARYPYENPERERSK